MCGGGSKAPDVQPAPKVDPRPTIEPTEASAKGQQETRNQRIRQYRSGFASTLKTGPLGVNNTQEQKTTLGQ